MTQRLLVAARLFPAILAGEKTHTIRWRETRIAPGPMLYLCDGSDRRTVVEVWRCTDMPLREAAAFLGRSADWPDPVMLAGMREHYPSITLDEVVQVVEHHPPLDAGRDRGP